MAFLFIIILTKLWLLSLPTTAIKVTGATGATNLDARTLPSRYEINDLASSGPAFDLYILSLQRLQELNQTDSLSYYQIAGIHGYPVTPWDGVVGHGGYPGYCMHSSVLFLTWHRPYVALFEQMIWKHAQDIARTYPVAQRDHYQAVALDLRIPYWDWGSRPALPSIATTPELSINTPLGQSTVQNPLYRYTFHPGPEGNGFPDGLTLSELPSTTRYYSSVTGMRNDSAANAVLMANAPSIMSLTYQILASGDDYTTISCTSPGGRANGPNNIENVHNSIHNFVGGYGHMTSPGLAAYDPVFWLHHANVDRVFAMWQAINPQNYVVPVVNTYGSYYESAGTIESSNTSLAPFHSDNGTTLFDSTGIRDTATFGYSYAELGDGTLNSSQLAAHVRARVNQLYAPDAATESSIARPSRARRASSIEEAFSEVTFESSRSLGVNGLEMQWSIDILAGEDSHNRSYNIDFFMGPIPPIQRSSTSPNLIGTYAPFVFTKVHSQPEHLSRSLPGGISITHTVAAGVARGFLKDLSPSSVIPVLQAHLHWRARSADDCEVDLSGLSSLSIMVRSRALQPRRSPDEFPLYGDYVDHPEATIGRSGCITV